MYYLFIFMFFLPGLGTSGAAPLPQADHLHPMKSEPPTPTRAPDNRLIKM